MFAAQGRRRSCWLRLGIACLAVSSVAAAKDPPQYTPFAVGEWKPAFTNAQSLAGARNAEFMDGVVTLNDGFARDASAAAVSAKNLLVRAQVRGRGALFVRGPTENYIAWFGEGAVGVNKYVDQKVHVLGMRQVTLNPQAFHELALAAVGDRVLVFVDGRRLLDVVDGAAVNAAAAALQSYQTKADFKDVEVMSLDGLDVTQRLPERDPLAKAVGIYDAQRTMTLAGKPPQQSTGVMHLARANLADFYIVRGAASDGSSSLFVEQFLPEASANRTWLFFSNGTRDRYDKGYDPVTGTHTIPAHPRPNGVMSGSIRRLDANTGETRFKTVGPDGTVVAEFVSINQRRAEAGPPPRLRATGPDPQVPELALLASYVGSWEMEVRIGPTKFEAQPRTERMTDDTEWILGGRFLMRLERKPDGSLLNLHLAGYDPAAKAFVFTAFQASGNVVQWRTTWDAEAKTFHNTLLDLPEGWVGTGRDRVADADTLEGQGLFKNAEGEALWNATVTRRRRK